MMPAGGVALADRGRQETGAVTSPRSSSVFAGFRFPREVISVAVRWYLRYGLSYGDVEKLPAERGVTVDHVTACRWVQRFRPELIEAARLCRHAPGDRWLAGETCVKVSGRWTYLYRAIDQHGQAAARQRSGTGVCGVRHGALGCAACAGQQGLDEDSRNCGVDPGDIAGDAGDDGVMTLRGAEHAG